MKKIYLSLLIGLFALSSQAQEIVNQNDLKRLYNLMKGFYSSEAQSIADSAFFDIRLKMVPMWQDYEGYWLYVEQAMAGSEDKPYRQRVYSLSIKDDTTIESRVYTIKNGAQYYGEWKKYSPLQNLTLDSLEERKGCSILLHKIERNYFVGSTFEKDCESNLKGASYATSDVSIEYNQLNSWDRGFDINGKQVWGATKSGYVFLKYKYQY